MWPMSVVNNVLKWLISSLAVRFRHRLIVKAQSLYLSPTSLAFYKVASNRQIDQLIVHDMAKFSSTLAHLLTDISKPCVDIALFGRRLAQSIDANAPLSLLGYFGVSGAVLRLIAPPFARWTAQEQQLEAEFARGHSRIVAHAEEICFYRGAEKERQLMERAFSKVRNHVQRVLKVKFWNGVLDSVLVKYMATEIAFLLLSQLAFRKKEGSSIKLMELYSKNSSFMVNLAQAVARLVLAGKELSRFSGLTARVAGLFAELESVQNDQSLAPADSNTSKCEKIILCNVPVVTPGGQMLIKPLTLAIQPGMNVLVTGPNGSGKSSLFRLLGGLWPLTAGTMKVPEPGKLFYIPQRPYLFSGTLSDQITYPTLNPGLNSSNDLEMLHLLETVQLSYILDRCPEGLATCKDWNDVLSGGEKQRIAIARLFWHRPQWAILDEGTSAVTLDIETMVYHKLQEWGVTVISVSHRQSLHQFHQWELKLDGQGGWKFGRLGE